MKNPMLYKIGMESQLYGTRQFIQWLLYAIWHGILSYFICFYCLTQQQTHIGADGQDIGFWVSGHVVYGACIFVANCLIIVRFNNFVGYGEGTVLLMISAFFIILCFESQFSAFAEVYGIFGRMFGSKLVWLCLIFISGQTVVFELLLRFLPLLVEDSTLL